MPHPLEWMRGRLVVLDTGTPIVFIGILEEVAEDVFLLSDADTHDCRDGHATKEHYLVDAAKDGVTVNRRRIIVMRRAIISVSLLEDIVMS